MVETHLTKNALECAQVLSQRLKRKSGESNFFFFGNSPCSLDAVIFAAFAPIFAAPLPNSTMKNKLENYAEIKDYVDRIAQRFFPPTIHQKQNKKPEGGVEEEEKKSEVKQFVSFSNVLSVCAASVAMAFYAYKSGLWKNVANHLK